MFPFFTILGRTIGMYQVMILAGIFASGIYVIKITKKNGCDDNDAIIFLLIVSVGVFLGGHILYSIVNYRMFINVIKKINVINTFDIFLSAIFLVWGGDVFYGGLFGGIFAAVILVKKKPQYGYLFDIVTAAIPLFHFFGRTGCFFAGCCFGIESAFGFTFRHSIIEEANGINRFPVQLLEAIVNLLLFFILDFFRRKNFFQEKMIYFYLIFYSAARFFIEFLRGDEYRGFFFALSTSQIISILVFGFSMFKLYGFLIKRPKFFKINVI